MKTNSHIAAAIAAVLCLFRRAHATDCALRPNETDENFYGWDTIIVTDQDAVDTALDGCDTVDGNLMISMYYNGPLTISVTNFSGTISQSTYYAPSVTNFSMPLATYIHTIYLENLPSLENLLLPMVTDMDTLYISGNGSINVVCGYLENASVVDMQGSAIDANFSMLSQVDDSLSIGAADTSSNFVVDFPSLVNATFISLVGNISSLNMPNLAVALGANTSDLLYDTFGLSITNYGSALDVDLPSLYNATGVSMVGEFNSLSFPSLNTLNGMLSITMDSPLDIKLPSLESVMAISLGGEISGFSMPAIKDIQSWVEISSTLDMDCDKPKAQWAAANNNYIPGTLDTEVTHRFSCHNGGEKKPFAGGAIAGIAIGALIFVGLIALYVVMMCRKYRLALPFGPTISPILATGGRNDFKPMVPQYEHELDLRSPRREAPPAYAASVQSELGPVAEVASQV